MTKADARRIEYMSVDDLLDADRNAKDHDGPTLRKSFHRFGYLQSIFLDERTGKILGGHSRRDELLAMRAAGEPAPNDVRVENGTWYAPVERGWSSRDDAEAEAAAIALNRVGEGLWNRDELWQQLADLSQTADGLEGIGYTAEDLADLAELLHPPDIDDLARHYGEPGEEDLWPVLRFRIPPELRDRWEALCAGLDGDAAQVGHVVTLAERP